MVTQTASTRICYVLYFVALGFLKGSCRLEQLKGRSKINIEER